MLEVHFNWHKNTFSPEERDDGKQDVWIVVLTPEGVTSINYIFKEKFSDVVQSCNILAWAYLEDVLPIIEHKGNSKVTWFSMKQEPPQMEGMYVVVLKEYSHDEYGSYEMTRLTRRKFSITGSRSVFQSVNVEEVLFWTTDECFRSDERLKLGLGIK